MKNILVPTDLGTCTHTTLRYAVSLSAKSHTKLFVFHADVAKKENLKEYARKLVKDIFKELNLPFDYSRVEFIIENAPFSNAQIKKVVEKNHIDLVIMGSSPDMLRTTFFGSHVSEFINEVDCPVLSIPHSYTGVNIDRIGLASELHDLPEKIREIVPFARMFNASIEAFHVYPVYPQFVEVAKYDVKAELLKLKKENGYDNINLHFIKTMLDNEPVTGIREFIKAYKPDMLVMCHKPRGLFDKLVLDSGTTPAVVNQSPLPILALNENTACKL
jgi:nucleotide-binding universal stress UspA family protein